MSGPIPRLVDYAQNFNYAYADNLTIPRSLSVGLSVGAQAGEWIVVFASAIFNTATASTPAPSDSSGNAYSTLATGPTFTAPTPQSGTASAACAVWIARAVNPVPAGGSVTITVPSSVYPIQMLLNVWVVHGLDPAAPNANVTGTGQLSNQPVPGEAGLTVSTTGTFSRGNGVLLALGYAFASYNISFSDTDNWVFTITPGGGGNYRASVISNYAGTPPYTGYIVGINVSQVVASGTIAPTTARTLALTAKPSVTGVTFQRWMAVLVLQGPAPQPPSAPALQRTTGFPAGRPHDFTWTFVPSQEGDQQTAYQLQILQGSTVVYDSGEVVSGAQAHTVPANTVQDNVTYTWRVRTWGTYAGTDASQASAWASDTFTTVGAPTVAITTPATDGTVVGAQWLTVTWTYASPGSLPQGAYRVRLLQGATALSDTGKTLGTATQATVGPLASGQAYAVEVTCWDTNDSATTVTRTFSASYVPPWPPAITASTAPGGGAVRLTITPLS